MRHVRLDHHHQFLQNIFDSDHPPEYLFSLFVSGLEDNPRKRALRTRGELDNARSPESHSSDSSSDQSKETKSEPILKYAHERAKYLSRDLVETIILVICFFLLALFIPPSMEGRYQSSMEESLSQIGETVEKVPGELAGMASDIPSRRPITVSQDVVARLDMLEQKHEILLSGSDQRNEQLQTLLQWLGASFVFFTVVFGGIAAIAGLRQSRQQGKFIDSHVKTASNVSDVLDSVDNILKNRLLTIKKDEEKISNLEKDLKMVTRIAERWEAGQKIQYRRLEDIAEKLSKFSRHEFKSTTRVAGLNIFAHDFDNFIRQYPEKEEENGFSSRSLYVRGIASVFAGNPDEAEKYLNRVVALESSKEKNEEVSKRLANSYYYLGINYSNFGEFDEAIKLLEKAFSISKDKKDILTRIVMAENYLMSGQFDDAEEMFNEIEEGVTIFRNSQKGELYPHQKLLQSRALLLRANKYLLVKDHNWRTQALNYARDAHNAAPMYYYASFTLAQLLYMGSNKEKDDSREFFRTTYADIQASGHLHFITETRIRILLVMVAAISGKYSDSISGYEFDDYLYRAMSLADELPKRGDKSCTVFSPISKENVDDKTIVHHIEEIRKGTILL